MSKSWKLSWFRDHSGVLRFVVLCLLLQNLGLCCSLNEEGSGILSLWNLIFSYDQWLESWKMISGFYVQVRLF